MLFTVGSESMGPTRPGRAGAFELHACLAVTLAEGLCRSFIASAGSCRED